MYNKQKTEILMYDFFISHSDIKIIVTKIDYYKTKLFRFLQKNISIMQYLIWKKNTTPEIHFRTKHF